MNNIINRNETNTSKKNYIIKYSKEEEKYFSKLFQQLDVKKEGCLEINSVIKYVKNYSGLNDETIKKIFSSIKPKISNCFQKNEFYYILRLISLAQNKIPYTIESLLNNPLIPPLPKFNSSNNSTSTTNTKSLELNKDTINEYKRIFDQIKDTNKDYITIFKALIYFKEDKKFGDKTEKVLDLLKPYGKYDNLLNLKEFIIALFLLSKYKDDEIPSKLDDNLQKFLARNKKTNNVLNTNDISNLRNIPNPIAETIEKIYPSRIIKKWNYEKNQINDKIIENTKIHEQLNAKMKEINEKINEINKQLQELKKEEKCIQNQINLNQKEYNDLIKQQSKYNDLIEKTKDIKNSNKQEIKDIRNSNKQDINNSNLQHFKDIKNSNKQDIKDIRNNNIQNIKDIKYSKIKYIKNCTIQDINNINISKKSNNSFTNDKNNQKIEHLNTLNNFENSVNNLDKILKKENNTKNLKINNRNMPRCNTSFYSGGFQSMTYSNVTNNNNSIQRNISGQLSINNNNS